MQMEPVVDGEKEEVVHVEAYASDQSFQKNLIRHLEMAQLIETQLEEAAKVAEVRSLKQ